MHTIEPHAPSEAPDEQPPGRRGPPDWVRILLLLALTGALLGGMNWLIHSAPGPTSPVPTATVAPAIVPAPIAQATKLPTPVPTPRSTVAPTATIVPTAAPTVAPSVASALNSDWWNWSSSSVNPEEEIEVRAAVDADWANVTHAWWYLDWQALKDTETEPHLAAFTSILQERRIESKSQKVEVERRDEVVHYLDGGIAVVYETYVNHSVAVNFSNGHSLEPAPNDYEAVSYLLSKIDGSYKVAEIAHHDAPQTR